MPDRLPELRDIITRDYEETRALIEKLPADSLAKETSNGWNVAQLAGHVANSSRGAIFVIGRLRRGGNATVPRPLAFIVNVMNWRDARKFKSATKADLLGAAEASHNDLIAALNGVSEEELDRGGEVLSLGKMTMFEYLKQSGNHAREHAADLRQAAGI